MPEIPQPMTDLYIEDAVSIEAPVWTVWRTITEPEEISRWFAPRVELDPVPGGRGVFVFEDDRGEPSHTAPLVVETVDPPNRFSFRWCQPDGDEPRPGNSTLVEFRLVEEGPERTRLMVSEGEVETTDWADEEKVRFSEDHRNGWRRFLGRLDDLLAGRPVDRAGA